MRKNKKKLLLKFILWLIFGAFLVFVFRINYQKLQNNTYSNYEKALDYGLVKYSAKPENPIIIAVFYSGLQKKASFLSGIFSKALHFDVTNAKILIVPTDSNPKASKMVEHLYQNVYHKNHLTDVLLLLDNQIFATHMSNLLTNNMPQATLTTEISLNGNEPDEQKIKDCLQKDGCLVVFGANLSDKNILTTNRLVNDALFYAGKNNLHLLVMDMLDNQANDTYLQGNSVAPILFNNNANLKLKQQKLNLNQYILQYWPTLEEYISLNLNEQSFKIPPKSVINYRLYDRATIYLKSYDFNYNTVYEELSLDQQNALAATLVNMIQNSKKSDIKNRIRYYEIYLLTDMEELYVNQDNDLTDFLEDDDGIYVVYKDKTAIMVTNDRPVIVENTVKTLRQKAKISDQIKNKDIHFYRFKSVEADYENQRL